MRKWIVGLSFFLLAFSVQPLMAQSQSPFSSSNERGQSRSVRSQADREAKAEAQRLIRRREAHRARMRSARLYLRKRRGVSALRPSVSRNQYFGVQNLNRTAHWPFHGWVPAPSTSRMLGR